MVDAPPGGLTPKAAAAAAWEVEVAGERFAADVALRPMYDPTNSRILA
jgi:hypothetical protein